MVDLSWWFKKTRTEKAQYWSLVQSLPYLGGSNPLAAVRSYPRKMKSKSGCLLSFLLLDPPLQKRPWPKKALDVNKTQRNEILGLQKNSKKPTNTERHKPTVFWFCNVPRAVGDLVYIFWVLRIVKRRLISPAGWHSKWRKKSTGGLAFKRCHKNTWRCIEIFETYWKVKFCSPLQKESFLLTSLLNILWNAINKSIGNKRLENARYLSRNGRQRAWEPE